MGGHHAKDRVLCAELQEGAEVFWDGLRELCRGDREVMTRLVCGTDEARVGLGHLTRRRATHFIRGWFRGVAETLGTDELGLLRRAGIRTGKVAQSAAPTAPVQSLEKSIEQHAVRLLELCGNSSQLLRVFLEDDEEPEVAAIARHLETHWLHGWLRGVADARGTMEIPLLESLGLLR